MEHGRQWLIFHVMTNPSVCVCEKEGRIQDSIPLLLMPLVHITMFRHHWNSLSIPPPPFFPLWVIFSHNTYCLDFHHSVFNTVGKYHTLDLRVPWALPFFLTCWFITNFQLDSFDKKIVMLFMLTFHFVGR